MTNETTKALLMILILGGVEAAIHISKIWPSQQRVARRSDAARPINNHLD